MRQGATPSCEWTVPVAGWDEVARLTGCPIPPAGTPETEWRAEGDGAWSAPRPESDDTYYLSR